MTPQHEHDHNDLGSVSLVGDMSGLDMGIITWISPDLASNPDLEALMYHAGLDPWWDERPEMEKAWDTLINSEVLTLVQEEGMPDEDALLIFGGAVLNLRNCDNILINAHGHIDLARQYARGYLRGAHDGLLRGGSVWNAESARGRPATSLDDLLKAMEEQGGHL